MGEAALFFQAGAALVVERALVREQAFLPAGQEHGVEFQALGRVQGHDVDGVGIGALVFVHHQRDVLQKTLQVLELLHGADQLLEVFQAAGGVGGAVLLPHLGVAGFIEDDLGQLVVRQGIALLAPAVEGFEHAAQRAARFWLQLVGLDDGARGFGERHAALAGVVVQHLHRGIAEPALGHVDDALEGEIVGRRVHDAQIGQRVADFGALIETRPADDAIGQAERDEAVFEFAHLERGAHQDGDLVEAMAAALQLLDLLADGAGFFLGIPRAGDGDLLAQFVVGAQRLAEPAFVVGDDVRGGGEDVAGRAVIALQPDHLGAGKIVLEAQNVVDLGAAPAVDRLIVVADAADVFGPNLCRSFRGAPSGASPRNQAAAAGVIIPGSLASRRPGMTVVADVCAAPTAAATDTAPRWCPGIRPPE